MTTAQASGSHWQLLSLTAKYRVPRVSFELPQWMQRQVEGRGTEGGDQNVLSVTLGAVQHPLPVIKRTL